MKVCPICKSRCFDDMDTCYGCLHNFSKEYDDDVFAYPDSSDISILPNIPEPTNIPEAKQIPEPTNIPEYFELDSFPQIEEVPDFKDELLDDSFLYNEESLCDIQIPVDESNETIKLNIEIPKSLLKSLT